MHPLNQPHRQQRDLPLVIILGTVYLSALLLMTGVYHQPVGENLIFLLVMGAALPYIATWVLPRINYTTPADPHPAKEVVFLILILTWILFYITWGTGMINHLLPAAEQNNPEFLFFFRIAKKLVVFVLLPFALYRAMHLPSILFPAEGKKPRRATFWGVLLLCGLITAFQCFFGRSLAQLRTNSFSTGAILLAAPLTFLALCLEAGCVEEFFFRVLLQSRLEPLLRSQTAAILLTGLLFGLIHAPGLYLRGAESEGVSEQLPLLFWMGFCVLHMSTIGIFFGVVWARTRNFFLVVALHAVADLLPALPEFLRLFFRH